MTLYLTVIVIVVVVVVIFVLILKLMLIVILNALCPRTAAMLNAVPAARALGDAFFGGNSLFSRRDAQLLYYIIGYVSLYYVVYKHYIMSSLY